MKRIIYQATIRKLFIIGLTVLPFRMINDEIFFDNSCDISTHGVERYPVARWNELTHVRTYIQEKNS